MPATRTPMVPTLELVPFVQKKGEEIPDFNTVYYDRATKRIMKRMERKVEEAARNEEEETKGSSMRSSKSKKQKG